MTNHTPKDILDKYQPMIIRKNKVFLRDGEAQVNNHDQEKYNPTNYSEDIVLQVAPKDAIILEFEDTPEHNKRYIAEIEEACRVKGIQYCISSHKGKSEYLRIYNLKGIPVNEDNKLAKNLLIATILPPGAKQFLDKTNLGHTLSPVIGHPHWKPKYNGTRHEIIRGIHPLDQINEYPLELLKKIQKAKKIQKTHASETISTNMWVNDFLVNYCTTHELPGGARHHVIEKNLAAMVFHREDRDTIIEKYLQMQNRSTDTTRTWMTAIANGQYTQVSVLEIKRYIEDHNIPYTIKKDDTASPSKTDAPDDDDITILKDPQLLEKTVYEIQKQGVEGEETSILVLINKTCLRLVKNHNPTSSNTVISDKTGAGKDVTTKNTLRVLVPEKDTIHRNRFSDKALEYMCIGKDDDYTLDGKVIYLEDPEEELLKSQVLRVLASGQNKATVVKDQELLELEVKGKPVIIVTSMNATIDEEGGRRWDGISIDTSPKQTENVIDRKLKLAEGYEKKPMPPLVKALHTLQRVEVIIPYATKLSPYFKNNTNIIMRTQVDKLLDYIKASAALYQHQRQRNDNKQIIADYFDYEYGKFMFTALGDAEGGVLNVTEKRLIEILKESLGDPLSYKEIVNKGLGKSKQWIYNHENELVSKGIISLCESWDAEANRNVTKAQCTFGYSSIPLPNSLVLTGFNSQFENQNKEGFNGFNGFINILRELNKKRNEHGLLEIEFEDIDEHKKILNVLHSCENRENRENLSVGAFNNACENLENLPVGQEGKEDSPMNIDVNDHNNGLNHIKSQGAGVIVIKPKENKTEKKKT